MAPGNVDWDTAFWEYLPRLYNFFLYRFADEHVAEDLTATTFEKAWRHRDQYQQGRGSLGTWLLSIARHTATDYWRQHRREISLDTLPHLTSGESFEDGIDEDLIHQNDCHQLTRLLQQLDTREQELVALKYGADLTNRAIAQLTGLSESNVGTILSRVVKRLREIWEPIYHE